MSRVIVVKLLVFVMVFTISCFAVSKPMESVENYNILMVHGAYGWNEGFIWPHMPKSYWEDDYGMEDLWFQDHVEYGTIIGEDTIFANPKLSDVIKKLDEELPSAYDDTVYLGKANLGRYDSEDRLTYWLNKNIFEDDSSRKPQDSYIYHWRSFSNPANSSSNNAHELGDRKWNQGNINYGKGGFGHRRALTEEAQEVKANVIIDSKDDSKNLYGQVALDSIRQNADLYRQLASRYILVGHSMGGVVSREYVQGNYYNGDVDKIITLDSPHEGTGSLNMQVAKEARDRLGENATEQLAQAALFSGLLGFTLSLVASDEVAVKTAIIMLATSFALEGIISPVFARAFSPQIYHKSDPLVGYVDPRKRGENTIYSLNQRLYDADKQPMYRILASKNGMTFTDPTPDSRSSEFYRALVPDVISLPFENAISQLTGNSKGVVTYVNMKTSFIVQ